jgi:hypothetical protein
MDLVNLSIANSSASPMSAIKSAPTYPGVFLARNLQSRLGSTVTLRHKTLRIFSREASSGIPSAISLSKRPGLRKAASSESGQLVAPITKTRLLDRPKSIGMSAGQLRVHQGGNVSAQIAFDLPSIHFNSWETIRRSISR